VPNNRHHHVPKEFVQHLLHLLFDAQLDPSQPLAPDFGEIGQA